MVGAAIPNSNFITFKSLPKFVIPISLFTGARFQKKRRINLRFEFLTFESSESSGYPEKIIWRFTVFYTTVSGENYLEILIFLLYNYIRRKLSGDLKQSPCNYAIVRSNFLIQVFIILISSFFIIT